MERVDGPCRGEPSPRKPLLIHCRHDVTEPLTLVLPDSELFFEAPFLYFVVSDWEVLYKVIAGYRTDVVVYDTS